MIGEKTPKKDIEYYSHFLSKKSTLGIPSHLSDSELKDFFSKDISYTRGFMSSRNWWGRNVFNSREYSIAKKVSDEYSMDWNSMLTYIQDMEAYSRNIRSTFSPKIWKQTVTDASKNGETKRQEENELDEYNPKNYQNMFQQPLEKILSEGYF